MTSTPEQPGPYDQGGAPRPDQSSSPGAFQAYTQQNPYPDPSMGGVPTGYAQQGPVPPTKAVRTAINLMWAGLGVQVIATLLTLAMRSTIRDAALRSNPDLTPHQLDAAVGIATASSLVGLVIGAALWLVNIVYNRRGKSWARIFSTVCGVIGIASGLFSSVSSASTGPLKLIAVVQLVLAAVILFFLWRPENRPFYEINSRKV